MLGFVNVLEEILVRETYIQIEELPPEKQPKVKVAEVVAYALNRLPPLFATSINGWQYQYAYAVNELSPQISQSVKHGIKTVLFGDPLHDLTPLPNHLFTNSSGVLYQLSQILGRRHLRWRDVPALVESVITRSQYVSKNRGQTIIQSDEATVVQDISHLSRQQKALISSSRRFMEKQLIQKQQELRQRELNQHSYEAQWQMYGNSWAWEKKIKDAAEMEYRALQSYTLQAQLGLVNVLEHLIFRAIEQVTKPELFARINHSEVAAYALNRLPPMYATSDRGFKYLRQRAINEFARELVGAVRTGIMRVLQVSYADIPPIYAYQFEQEYIQSMQQLNYLFKRNDISLHNIVAIVQDLLERKSA
ncbi:late competence development ComFB family protein [Pseudanabaena sp. UWO310]|uniref:late competence development ComFB family protein n=1 Tax=Pseudanabaena sp. UWO310 TaxID=2480795 RepID=UPI0011583D54|nr:late competence development ComFB family protein [Pseudanabaena sp. UWO310]TYQ29294.1 hypothetical protein PseudUWO310_12955 [Pseudanabaena sp. UWO310]